MKRLISIASVAGLTLALVCFTPIHSKNPDKPGGGGGGGGSAAEARLHSVCLPDASCAWSKTAPVAVTG